MVCTFQFHQSVIQTDEDSKWYSKYAFLSNTRYVNTIGSIPDFGLKAFKGISEMLREFQRFFGDLRSILEVLQAF